MGRLYLSSIMKVQTSIFFFLVALCLCVNHISAKNIPDTNDVEIEKSEADAVLKRIRRGWFGGKEKEEEDDDDDRDDYGDYYNDEESSNQEENDNARGNNAGGNSGPGNNGPGNKRKVQKWVNLVVGIIDLIKKAGVF